MKRIYFLLTTTFLIISLSNSSFAESKKMVFVEEYSSAYCGTYAYFAPTYKAVGEQMKDDIIPIVVATGDGPGDPFYRHNPDSSRRVGLYVNGSYGTPAVWVDGEKVAYNQYQSNISSYTGGMSPITIYALENREEAGKLKMKVIVQSDEALNSSHRMFLFVVEKDIYYPNAGSTSQSEFHWMTRQILPNSTAGAPLDIEAGGVQSFAYSMDISDDWDMDEIYLVAIVQDMGSNDLEVLQAAKTWEDLSVIVPEISSNTNRIDFGDVTDYVEETLTISNTGLDDLMITDISISGDEAGVYSILSSLPDELAPGEKAELDIRFFPTENGTYNSVITIESNSRNNSTMIVDLKGKATNIVPFGQISIEEQSIDFGDVATEKTMSVMINNEGTGPLTLSSIALIDDDDEVYTVMGETENVVIDKASNYNLELKFKPKADNQYYFAELIITSDSKNDQEVSVIIRGKGEGVGTADPVFTLDLGGGDNETLDFGDVFGGEERSFTISNTGGGEIMIKICLWLQMVMVVSLHLK